MATSQNRCFMNAILRTIQCDRLSGPARSHCYAQAYRAMRKCFRQSGGVITGIQLGPVKSVARLLLAANGAERKKLVKAIVAGAALGQALQRGSKSGRKVRSRR